MDGWLTDGICETCRRRNYCTAKCKAHKEREKEQLYNIVPVAVNAFYRMLAERRTEE